MTTEFFSVVICLTSYKLKIVTIAGTSIGTDDVKITPEKNATMDISEVLLLFITGSSVSIAVAPAAETDSKAPNFLAIIGTKIMAKTSRTTLLKKARLPRWALILESSMADKEYQPSPALTAMLCPTLSGVIREAIAPPRREPNIVQIGNNHIFFPKVLKSANNPELSPISIPTKKRRRHNPKSIKLPELERIKSDLKKYPNSPPTMMEIETPSIYIPLFLKTMNVIKILNITDNEPIIKA